MRKQIAVVAAGLVVLTAMGATAGDILQLSLFSPVSLSSPDHDVTGLRLNIYGKNQNVTGLDLGIVNRTEQDFTGVGIGIVTMVKGDGKGIQLPHYGAGLVDGNFTGLNWGGCYNRVGGQMTGVHISLVTHTKMTKGIQLGLVNIADDMLGVQVGLANIIKANKVFKFFPIVNARF